MTPQRVQRKRSKGYRLPANTVSVTRPGIFGNPFTGPEAVALFRAFLEGGTIVAQGDPESLQAMEETRATILRRLPELRGKNLACYCPLDKPCHADVLLELANRET